LVGAVVGSGASAVFVGPQSRGVVFGAVNVFDDVDFACGVGWTGGGIVIAEKPWRCQYRALLDSLACSNISSLISP